MPPPPGGQQVHSRAVGASSQQNLPRARNGQGPSVSGATASGAPAAAATASSGRGGGAFRSIGENFQVNRANGTFSLRMPIHTTPSPSGFGPSLALTYDSGQGNGPFGIGWSLSLGAISRKTAHRVPKYDHSDVFVLSGVDDLVPVVGEAPQTEVGVENEGVFSIQVYRPRTENHACRIQKWTNCEDETEVHWRVISDTNVTTVYGASNDSRVIDSPVRPRIFSWLPCRAWDAYGHEIEYEYKAEDVEPPIPPTDFLALSETGRSEHACTRQKYLKAIRYGNRIPNRDLDTWVPLPFDVPREWCFEVILDYGEHDEEAPSTTTSTSCPWPRRQDPFSVANSGFEIRSSRLCRRVLMFHHFLDELHRKDCLVGSTVFQYNELPTGSFLRSLQHRGHRPDGQTKYRTETMPPFEVFYTPNRALETLQVKSLENFYQELGPTRRGTHSSWVDLNGDGAPGLFHVLGDGSCIYQRNENALLDSPDEAARMGAPVVLPSHPDLSSASDFYLTDLDGTGHLSVVYNNTVGLPSSYVERSGGSWAEQVAFQTVPKACPKQMTHLIDLTGNGLEDILFVDQEAGLHEWYESLGKTGFAPARTVASGPNQPVLLSQSKTMAIFLADMTGDGLTDIVTVGNGTVSYWQNFGFGCFGSKVSMSHAPWVDAEDQFSVSRIRLADVDGSGPADLLYMPASGGLQIYPNCAGNGWGKERKIVSFPAIDNLSSVAVMDLLGKGTACICWTGVDSTGSRPSALFYLDLMSGSKPNLLCKFTNGLGKTTKVSYRPSTQFFLEDERNRRNWTTRLPFPVHCVHKTVETDAIANTSYTTRFAYHDGYFDPGERSFRGFGMVEEWDAAEFNVGTAATFEKPPIHTKTWFHTGSPQYHVLHSHPDFPSRLLNPFNAQIGSETASFDVSRALHGMQLRQENYSDDGSVISSLPFSLTENSFRVSLIQKRHHDRPPVLMVTQTETVSQQVDRTLRESKLDRNLVLGVNEYGDASEVAHVAYGRGKSELAGAEDQAKQEETHLSYTTTQYTGPVDDFDDICNYRRPLVCETADFRVAGIAPSAFHDAEARFELWLREMLRESPELYYESDMPPSDKPFKVMVAKSRHYFHAEDFSGRLALGKLEPFSTLDQSYQLVFTKHMLQSLYADVPGTVSIGDGEMQEGGYQCLDQDGCWWSAGPQALFGDDGVGTLATARASFYNPTISKDAFGNQTITEFDARKMLVTKITDPAGNQTQLTYDYVSLQPSQITSANDNRDAFLYDCFADRVCFARMGKLDELVGDSIHGADATLSEMDIQAFFQQPDVETAKKLLGGLSSRKLVDMNAYHRALAGGRVCPAVQATILRDTHSQGASSEKAEILVHFDYLDGYGNILQSCDLAGQSEEDQWCFAPQVVHDNVGNPVRKFRPYYSRDHHFKKPANTPGPVTTYLYDSLNRLVSTLSPDHSFTKTKFDAWKTTSFTAGKTVLTSDASKDSDVGELFARLPRQIYYPSWFSSRTDPPAASVLEQTAAQKSAHYHDKPTIDHYDALHRNILSVGDNGSKKLEIRSVYDVRGPRMKRIDPTNRVVECHRYDLLGREVYKSSMDAATEWYLPACDGQTMYHWNGRKINTHFGYDVLRRPLTEKVSEEGGPPRLVKRIMYGETLPLAKDKNLKGQVYKMYDQAGIHTHACFDLNSNCTQTETRLSTEFKTTIDWAADQELQDEVFITQHTFDALGRTLASRNARGATTRYEHTRGGAVKAVAWRADDAADWTTYIRDTVFNSDGLATRIEYGNDVSTSFTYDMPSKQLRNKKTVRTNGSVKILQDLTFTYDVEHRLIHSSDGAQRDVFFRNAVVTADREFSYNAIGDLVEARGREFLTAAAGESRNCPPYSSQNPCSQEILPGNGAQVCRYMETYVYDDARNIVQMRHEPVDDVHATGWTRDYLYEGSSQLERKGNSNKLVRTTVGKQDVNYLYEGGPGKQGCITGIPGYSELAWNYNDQLHASSTQKKKEGTPEMTWYVYDSSGDRVRKVTEYASEEGDSASRRRCETIFLPDLEIYKTFQGDGRTVRKTKYSHSVAAGTLVATVEQTIEKEDTRGLVRYSIGTSIELDDQGQVISYEEYSPYGSPTYVACGKDIEAPRRYRYAAYDRDRETGLYYCGARYYAPWLGRWLSPDPEGTIDGLNLFAYCRNDPVNYHDPAGTCRDNPRPEDGAPKPVSNLSRIANGLKALARRLCGLCTNRNRARVMPVGAGAGEPPGGQSQHVSIAIGIQGQAGSRASRQSLEELSSIRGSVHQDHAGSRASRQLLEELVANIGSAGHENQARPVPNKRRSSEDKRRLQAYLQRRAVVDAQHRRFISGIHGGGLQRVERNPLFVDRRPPRLRAQSADASSLTVIQLEDAAPVNSAGRPPPARNGWTRGLFNDELSQNLQGRAHPTYSVNPTSHYRNMRMKQSKQ